MILRPDQIDNEHREQWTKADKGLFMLYCHTCPGRMDDFVVKFRDEIDNVIFRVIIDNEDRPRFYNIAEEDLGEDLYAEFAEVLADPVKREEFIALARQKMKPLTKKSG